MSQWIYKPKWSSKALFAIGAIAILGLLWQMRTSSNVEKGTRLNDLRGRDKQWHSISGSSCVPQNSIAFIKVHKTGGSSIQNMCLRYAISHDLLIALPRMFNYFGHPTPFDKSMVPALEKGQKYNVFAHHTRFNYENLRDFMPEGTIFFTLLREPVSLFESAYAYFYMEMLYGMTLEEFVSHDKSALNQLNKRVTGGRIGRNQMAFDLGVNVKQFENEEEILRIAAALDQQFQLVMILERMNESLVLLKHLLCWSTDDVVVLHLNARAEKAKKKLTPELKDKIVSWNKADKILYDYFSESFDEKVKAFGEDRMKKEVEELTARIEKWQRYCVAGVLKNASAFAENIENFQLANVHNETCEYLTKDEMTFTKQLAKRQHKR